MKKIVFATRNDFYQKFGGDNVQLSKTKEFLEKYHNANVQICLNPNELEKYKDFQIVHIFNMQSSETLDYIKLCQKLNKKTVLSPVYWNLTDAYYSMVLSKINPNLINENFAAFKDFICLFANLTLNISPDFRKKRYFYPYTKLFKKVRQDILNSVDMIIPNSPEELRLLSKDFKLSFECLNRKSRIIPNAIDINLIKTTNDWSIHFADKIDNFILQVGRIEPIKNQLNLLKAFYDLPNINIVFVGAVGDKKYYKNLYKLARKRKNVYFIDKVPYSEVFYFYQKAKVHVMPSFRESPGLASIEALFSGCKVVTSSNKFCPTNYYEFDKLAYSCNPYSTSSIRDAVTKALESDIAVNLTPEYKKTFSYENVANLTYKAYLELC